MFDGERDLLSGSEPKGSTECQVTGRGETTTEVVTTLL